MQRPIGVIILSLWNFLGAALMTLGVVQTLRGLNLAGIIGMWAGPDVPGAYVLLLALGPGAGGFLVVFLPLLLVFWTHPSALDASLGLCLIVFASLAVVTGAGLWKLRNWARLLTLALVALNLISAVSLLPYSLQSDARMAFGLLLALAGVYAAVLAYLLTGGVKRAFGSTRPR